MGQFNSSVTRVWPIFDAFFRADPTGSSWLPELLRLGSLAGQSKYSVEAESSELLPELASFGLPLPGPLRKALGPEAAALVGSIRNAFESEIPPSKRFLRWMLEHPEQLTWPKDQAGTDRVFGVATQEKRRRLVSGDSAVRESALSELDQAGAIGSRKKWWAFEGFTSVDCRLETETLLLLVEGKRTEPTSEATDWFPGRNQVIRNLEVAQALAGDEKYYAVLLCSETPIELPEEAWARSLPHFNESQIKELMRHYLGNVTWQTMVEELCPELELPNTVDEAVALCMKIRQ